MGRSIQIVRDEPEGSALPVESLTLGVGGQPVARGAPEELPTQESLGGRTIYGGGGITPDLVVLPDTLSASEQASVQRLFRSAGVFATASFNHAVSYVQDHADLEPGFTLSAADLDRIYQNLVYEHEVVLDESDFMTAQRYVRYQLEREIALQAWGKEGAFLRTLGNDGPLRDAIEILKRAETPEALFDLASDARQTQAVGASASGVPGLN
ncbi:MAG: hypothetical protein MK335_01980 [Gemmatimonadetes bacterium]|nr:hypothetical protein [Gemmatimonadota bacterium]